jgi:hypothetical protein
MHREEQSSWVRTARKRRPARGRANDDVWHPGSPAVRPFAGPAFADESRSVARRRRGDLHPTTTAFPVTKGARRCSRRGSIRRRVEFLFSVPSARANQRSSQGGRHGARLAFSGYGRRASAVRHRTGNRAAREPSVRQAPRHSVFHRKVNRGSVARPRGRGVRGSSFLAESVPTFGVLVEVERRRRSRNVQRRGKPERCIDRIAEGAETPEANRRRAQDRSGQAARSGPPTASVDPKGWAGRVTALRGVGRRNRQDPIWIGASRCRSSEAR